MGLPVDCLERLTVRPFGETEDGAAAVIELIGDVANSVLLLDGQIEFVRSGDISGGGAGSIVPIEE